jgi:hypothetical protein
MESRTKTLHEMLLINGFAKVTNDPILQSACPDVAIGVRRREDGRIRMRTHIVPCGWLRLTVLSRVGPAERPRQEHTTASRAWGKRGTRPSAPSDQRTASTYIFGAICPKEGKAVGLILPRCNIEAMQSHLDEIAKDVAPGRHAVLMLDKAGRHTSPQLDVPENLTLLPLPAKCPELNPVEMSWTPDLGPLAKV